MREDHSHLTRRKFMRWALANAAGVCVGSLSAWGKFAEQSEPSLPDNLEEYDWGFLIDISRCIGCGRCVAACNQENHLSANHFRTWIERYEIDEQNRVYIDSPRGAVRGFLSNRRKTSVKGYFVPKQCHQCRDSACTQVCPVGATYHAPDGVVLIDQELCIGCGYCVQACPYGCRYIADPPGVADKCDMCYHRIHQNQKPVCVDFCPTHARIFGNLKDPQSPIRQILRKRHYTTLKPENKTDPKCFYLDLNPEVK